MQVFDKGTWNPFGRRLVSIPYSSGEKCKKGKSERGGFCPPAWFQSLIHQGKNARVKPVIRLSDGALMFQSLIHQGKNASAKQTNRPSLQAPYVSIPYSSGGKCKRKLRILSHSMSLKFQSLIHQGENARTLSIDESKKILMMFQSLIHQGENARKSIRRSLLET